MAISEFGKLVKKALIDRDMSQMELAEKIGTSPRYVGHIITGVKSPGKYEQPIRSELGLDQHAS